MEDIKLSNVNIGSFRSLSNVPLQELGMFNLLVGANNSGKTSILEAISICCRPLDSFQWVKAARGRDVPMGRTPIIESIKWLFPQNLAEIDAAEIQLKIEGSFKVRSIAAQYTSINAISTEQDDDANDELDGETDIVPERGAFVDVIVQAEQDTIERTNLEKFDELPPPEEIRKRFQLIEGHPLFQPTRRYYEHLLLPVRTVLPHTHRVDRVHFLPYLDGSAIGNELHHSVIELLQKFDQNIESISIIPRARLTATYIQHKTLGLVPLQVFGDGLRRIVQIALTLPLCQNGVLLLDEIETSIHSRRLVSFFDWLLAACRQFNVQLFATTHSLEAIDALIESTTSDNQFVTYKLSDDNDPDTCIRYDREMLRNLRNDFGMEIRW